MPSNHLILCRPLLLLPSIFPSIRVFSNESALCIRWPKYWSFCFNISPPNEHQGLISFRRLLAIWSLVPLPFLKPAWTSESSQIMYSWSLAWRILRITSIWDEWNCAVVWPFFAITFLCDWSENWLFPVLWLLLSFPHLLTYWVQHFNSIVNKAEIDVFLEFPCFFYDPVDVGNLISGSSAFSKSSLSIWNLTVPILLKSGLENFKRYFTSVCDECNCTVVWTFFGIAFLFF